MNDPAAVYETIQGEISEVLVGQEAAIEYLTIALLTRGHVLMEGVPGVAKTTIARLFARTSGLEYSRVQMTPDTLPADIVGTTVYREQTGEFTVQKGPVFANVVVADEINRATPKTQSALLEAMQEDTVTIDGETHDLPEPFLVVATQNPIEMEGTFELPEAQRDRFQFKIDVGLPDREEEGILLDRFDDDPELGPDDVADVVSAEDLLAAREAVAGQQVADSIKEYVLDIAAATRDHSRTTHGVSPRASIMLLNAAKARAALHGREYVIPDDVKALAGPSLAHRLVLSTDAELSDIHPRDVVDEIVGSVPVPSAAVDTDGVDGKESSAEGVDSKGADEGRTDDDVNEDDGGEADADESGPGEGDADDGEAVETRPDPEDEREPDARADSEAETASALRDGGDAESTTE